MMLLKPAALFFVAFCFASFIRGERLLLVRVLKVLVVSVVMLVLYSLADPSKWGGIWRLNFFGGYRGPNATAFHVLSVIPFSLAFALFSERRKWFWMLCSGVLMIGLGLTYSRGAVLSVGVGVVAAAVVAGLVRMRTMIGVVGLAGIVALFALPPVFWARLLTAFAIDAGSLSKMLEASSVMMSVNEFGYSNDVRMALSKAGMALVMRHPLLGVGPGRFTDALTEHGLLPELQAAASIVTQGFGSPHNQYLTVWLEGGVVAFGGFMLAVLTIMAGLKRRLWEERGEVRTVLAGFWLLWATYAVYFFVEWPMEREWFWVMVGLTIAGLQMPSTSAASSARAATPRQDRAGI